MSKLTFEALRAANASRAPRWHTSEEGMMEWTIGDWFMAMAGEVGEGADELLPLMFMAFVGKLGQLGNMAKKYRRVQEGIANKSEPGREIDADNALYKMFNEIADVQIYLDLFALRLREAMNTGEDIGNHVERVFNRTSEKYGFPERLVDGEFKLAIKGKLKIPGSDIEYEGEIYTDPPEEPERKITLTSDLPADDIYAMFAVHGVEPLTWNFGENYTERQKRAEQFAADVERTKYRGSWASRISTLGMPYGEQPFNERGIVGKFTEDPEQRSHRVLKIPADELRSQHSFIYSWSGPIDIDRLEINSDDTPYRIYNFDDPVQLKNGVTYVFGTDNNDQPFCRPLDAEKPDIPIVWHDGCGKCQFCAMDMDMDPFCVHPEVKKAAGHNLGVGINYSVNHVCGKNGKLSLFEPRK